MDTWDLWAAVWQRKRMVGLLVLAFTCAGVIYALLAEQWWRAEVVVIPADTFQQGGGLAKGLAGLDSGLGSLAGLAGIALGGQRTAEPLAVLQSRELAKEFIESQNLLPTLFWRKWDASKKRWKSSDPDEQPDVRDGIKYFTEHIMDVDDNKKTGLITLTVNWTDASLAAQWANGLVSMANEKMRRRALVDSQNNVEFLQAELNSTTLVAMQDPISRLLENELQKMMLARESKEFAFRVVDRAETPKFRHWPIRSLVVVLAGFAGGLVALLVVLWDDVRKRARLTRN